MRVAIAARQSQLSDALMKCNYRNPEIRAAAEQKIRDLLETNKVDHYCPVKNQTGRRSYQIQWFGFCNFV